MTTTTANTPLIFAPDSELAERIRTNLPKGDGLTAAHRITITAGIGFDSNGDALDVVGVVLPALAKIRAHLAGSFGGYTENAASGGWVGPDGELVAEASRTWTIVTASVDNARLAAEWIRDELRQQAVMLTVEPIRSAFV